MRGQEISLNDDERKRRGAEKIRKVEEQCSSTNHQESIDRRSQIFSAYEVRASRERVTKKTKEEQIYTENRLSDLPVDIKAEKAAFER